MFERKPNSTLEQFLQQVAHLQERLKDSKHARNIPNVRRAEGQSIYLSNGGMRHYHAVEDAKAILAERYRLDGVEVMKTELREISCDIDAIRDILIWLASNAVIELGQVTREIREYADNAE
jgi:hypothetical protein